MTKETKEHLAALGADVGPVDLMALDTAKHMNVASPCDIINPLTKAKTGARIWLFGEDSECVQNYINGEANAQLRKSADFAARGKQPEAPSVERSERRLLEKLIVATSHWEGVNIGGEVVDFTVQRAKELYKVKFIAKQLEEYMGEIENFMKA